MRIVIVGAGNLGSVVAKSLLSSGLSSDDIVLVARDLSKNDRVQQSTGVQPRELPSLANNDVIVLTVKPQDASALGVGLHGRIPPKAVILSMMAGVSIATLSEQLAHSIVARAMPNLGARVRESATTYYVPPSFSPEQEKLIERVVRSCGRAWKVAREELIDVATAVAGSGPAYVCWLGEQIEAVARECGLPEGDAHALVLQTLKGAVAYLEADGATFAELRERVTSPNGTTAAALEVLRRAEADATVRRAIRAAFDRAVELGSGALPGRGD
jgi:pyrroline-5-carboxylate reductase